MHGITSLTCPRKKKFHTELRHCFSKNPKCDIQLECVNFYPDGGFTSSVNGSSTINQSKDSESISTDGTHLIANTFLMHDTSVLSPGQTGLQVVASGRKLNLRRELRWVAKRTRKFPRKYTQVAKKTF